MILYKLILFLININIILNQEFNDELATYRIYESFVELKGGEFFMGINDREGVNYEYPQRKARVEPFRITLYPTTIGSFKKFKKEKYKYKTDAELTGSSWVFTPLINELAFNKTIDSQIDDIQNQESINLDMRLVLDARWNKPEGGKSSIKDRLNNPVVHVSFNDAFAYCAWKGMRLPTEIEWEFAARGSFREMLYPWGDKWELGRANLWQGKFPFENQLRDSYYGLSPVNAFNPQNNYEMFDLIGNIWEWTSTKFRDFRNETNLHIKKRVLKGGSFLDKRDGDNNGGVRIRTSARIARTEKYTSYNIGFRCAQTIQQNEQFKFENNLNYRIVKLRPPKKHSFHNTKFEL